MLVFGAGAFPASGIKDSYPLVMARGKNFVIAPMRRAGAIGAWAVSGQSRPREQFARGHPSHPKRGFPAKRARGSGITRSLGLLSTRSKVHNEVKRNEINHLSVFANARHPYRRTFAEVTPFGSSSTAVRTRVVVETWRVGLA
jgi:hypothetical protein